MKKKRQKNKSRDHPQRIVISTLFFFFIPNEKKKTFETRSKKVDADKGIAPLYSGHEPNMLLLHQPAFILKGI